MNCRKIVLFSAALLVAGSVWAQNNSSSFRNTQEAVRYYEDLVGSLAQQVRSLQDENARLSASVQNLQRQMESIARNNELVAKDITELRKTIAQDAEKRDKQFANFASKLNAAASVPINPPPARSGGDGFVADYEEYVVQRGATLTAIAKAYGVSVDSIRKANDMKSDMLRVGEKLKIPRK